MSQNLYGWPLLFLAKFYIIYDVNCHIYFDIFILKTLQVKIVSFFMIEGNDIKILFLKGEKYLITIKSLKE